MKKSWWHYFWPFRRDDTSDEDEFRKQLATVHVRKGDMEDAAERLRKARTAIHHRAQELTGDVDVEAPVKSA